MYLKKKYSKINASNERIWAEEIKDFIDSKGNIIEDFFKNCNEYKDIRGKYLEYTISEPDKKIDKEQLQKYYQEKYDEKLTDRIKKFWDVDVSNNSNLSESDIKENNILLKFVELCDEETKEFHNTLYCQDFDKNYNDDDEREQKEELQKKSILDMEGNIILKEYQEQFVPLLLKRRLSKSDGSKGNMEL